MITALETRPLRLQQLRRAHTGRSTKGRVPDEIVFGARMMGTVR
jgi:hypothetical protein